MPKYLATPNSRAFSVQNAHPHDNSDNVLFDNPFLVSPSAVVRRLPFSTGQIWRVNYEFDDQGGSHNGTAAFCWDFVRLDASTMQDPVVAAAPGLLSYVDDSVNGAGVVEVVPGQEADVYMHTAGGSWWNEFLEPGNYRSIRNPRNRGPGLPSTRASCSRSSIRANSISTVPSGAWAMVMAPNTRRIRPKYSGPFRARSTTISGSGRTCLRNATRRTPPTGRTTTAGSRCCVACRERVRFCGESIEQCRVREPCGSRGIVKLRRWLADTRMTDRSVSYHGYRFRPEMISHVVWLYHRSV